MARGTQAAVVPIDREHRAQTRARERADRERRQSHVWRLRFIDERTIAEIVAALRELDPPIEASARTVERDLVLIRREQARSLSVRGFDGRAELAAVLARYDVIARRAMRQALALDGSEGAVWARVALLASEAKTGLLERVGLVNPAVLQQPAEDDGQRAERIPSGVELQRLFDSVEVHEGELISDAERHLLYGDQGAAEAAERNRRNRNDPERDE